MKRILLGLTILLGFFASLGQADFRLLDETDEVRVMQREDDGSFEWEKYDSVQSCLDHYDIDGSSDIHLAGEVVYHYNVSNSYGYSYVHVWVSPEPYNDVDIAWKWSEYAHVYFNSDHHDIFNPDTHPEDYEDFITYMIEYGWFSEDDPDDALINSLDLNLQQMVDNARTAWGLALFPDSLPPRWRSHIKQKGGDWVKYGDSIGDYYIANVDITASYNYANPANSNYWRRHDTRRYHHTFDNNDLATELNYILLPVDPDRTEVTIDYNHHIVNVTMPDIAEIFGKIPNLAYVSFESKQGDKWYIARVRSKSLVDGILILNCVSKAKEGNFNNHERVVVGLEQS